MSTNTTDDKRKVTTSRITEMKARGEKIAMLTAYDYTTAKLIDEAGIDMILVGDSASNVMAGNATTLPITLDHMIYHAQCVSNGVSRALPYTRAQFPDPPETLCTAEDPLDRAGPGELCFAETADPAPWAARVEEIVLYRWNRRYPADLRFTLPLEGWTLVRSEEFAGSSHEKITKEVYRR